MNALNTSFDSKEVGGVTLLTWTPRTYAGQTDLGGGVAGAQASLVTFVRRMLDGSLKILDNIEPLVPNAGPEELSVARAIPRQAKAAPSASSVAMMTTTTRARCDTCASSSLARRSPRTTS